MNAQERLRAWRGERTLIQAAVALGCDPSTISLLENGKRKPGLALALKLEAVTAIPVAAWSESTADPRQPSVGPTVTAVNETPNGADS